MVTKEYAAEFEHRMESGLKPDACGSAVPMWFYLRRRMSDGFTRVEVTTSSEVHVVNTFGDCKFTVYLTDDERRSMAKALLEGLPH